jgi:uncharacterized protein (DUF58 family)
LLAAFALIVAFDALRAIPRLHELSFTSTGILRLSKGRHGWLGLRIDNRRPVERLVRLGLAMPAGLDTSQEELVVRIPAGPSVSAIQWPVRAVKRGNHQLKDIHAEAVAPWGLWNRRTALRLDAEVRVYPDLFTERAAVAAVFLHRGGSGIHAQRQVGKGRDFEKLRDYISGDSIDEVHWKATAKRGRPVTKIFQIERTQEVYVVVDSSRLSGRAIPISSSEFRGSSPELVGGSRLASTESQRETRNAKLEAPTPEPALERLVTSALLLGAAAERQGDLFGLVTFSNQVNGFVRAKNGPSHFAACRDALYTLEPQMVTPDFEELGSFLRLRLRRRALLVILTALDDPVLAEGFIRGVDLIRRQHLVLVTMLTPPGARPLFRNPDVHHVDDLYSELGGHLRWQNLRELEKILRRRGVGFAMLDDVNLSTGLVSQYLGVKRRQAL